MTKKFLQGHKDFTIEVIKAVILRGIGKQQMSCHNDSFISVTGMILAQFTCSKLCLENGGVFSCIRIDNHMKDGVMKNVIPVTQCMLL